MSHIIITRTTVSKWAMNLGPGCKFFRDEQAIQGSICCSEVLLFLIQCFCLIHLQVLAVFLLIVSAVAIGIIDKNKALQRVRDAGMLLHVYTCTVAKDCGSAVGAWHATFTLT